MSLALAGVLLLAPLWAWHIGAAWPPSLRDNAFKALALASIVMVALVAWPLAILWGLALWHWTDPDATVYGDRQPSIAGVLTIGTVVAVWLIAAATPAAETRWLRWGMLGAGLGQMGVLMYQAATLLRHRRQALGLTFWRDSLRGSMGNRVVTGAFLAFCFALAPGWLMPVFGVGVLATNSFTALGAAAVALVLRYPGWALWWGPGVVLAGLACYRFRGHPRDSAAGRARIWRLIWEAWVTDTWAARLVGRGHWAFGRHARRWHVQLLVQDIYSHAHQDALQGLLEYGLLGLLAVGLALGRMVPVMAWGDPWTAALAVGLVVSLNQFTLHLPHTGLPVVVTAGVLWGRL